MSLLRRTTLAILLTASAVVGPIGASPTSAAGLDLEARLRAACVRVPAVEARVDAITTRLEGDATVRGSLAWFAAQIAQATTDGHPKVAAGLQQRADVLTARLATLQLRAERLGRAADFCGRHGASA